MLVKNMDIALQYNEQSHGMNLPPGFLHVVYEVDDHEAHVGQLRKAGVRFLIEPEEIAYITRTLCDDRAKGINGQGIVVDGGSILS